MASDRIRAEFERLSADAPTRETILDFCVRAQQEATAFVEQRDLVSLQHDPVELIEMPEFDRGVALAYCRGVGSLETAPLQTLRGVADAGGLARRPGGLVLTWVTSRSGSCQRISAPRVLPGRCGSATT